MNCSEDLRTFIELCPSTAPLYSHSLTDLTFGSKKKKKHPVTVLTALPLRNATKVRTRRHTLCETISPHVKTHLANLSDSPASF